MSLGRYRVLATIEPGGFSSERVWSLADANGKPISGLADVDYTNEHGVIVDVIEIGKGRALVEFPDAQIFVVSQGLLYQK